MQRLKLRLKNCYGIKSLETDFDFSSTRAYALYAPNGVMKSSLARTLQDVAEQSESKDRIFSQRDTVRQITDENGLDIASENVLVVIPYDEEIKLSEQTSTLLLDPRLKQEYDGLLRATADAKDELLKAIRTQSSSKQDLETQISEAIMQEPSQFDAALIRVWREVQDQSDTPFADTQYDKIFNERVLAELNTKNLKDAIQDYAERYNELLLNSTYFKRGTFEYYNAGQIAKNLANNGFFDAQHTLILNDSTGSQEIKTRTELEEVITKEKEKILADQTLRKKFDDVANQLERNAQLRDFYEYVRDNAAILSCLSNPAKLKQDVIRSYLKVHSQLYADWMQKYDTAAERREQLEAEAREQSTQWERVIEIFNERFFVPFTLEATNRTEVLLGRESIIKLGFTYTDGADSERLQHGDLLKSLSTGERKALYILNVIFEIEARKKNNKQTLIVFDDIADSFDYRNKYAIIQYLKETGECDLFRLLVMTHNFDFFRTIESRFISYPYCLMAAKNGEGVTLRKAAGIKNIFARDWKLQFFEDPMKKIASIPFLRNIVEMTTGESDPSFSQLTSMLHWKSGSESITISELDAIYCKICDQDRSVSDSSRLVHELIVEQAEACMASESATNLEYKIVLAIAIRLMAERLMIGRIDDSEFVNSITSKQTYKLIERFRLEYPDEGEFIDVFDRVALMTPESIHVNSFMYEPLIDMSDDHLRKLYADVKALTGN